MHSAGDGEAIVPAGCRLHFDFLARDRALPVITDRHQECLNFRLGALGPELDPAIGQIAHPARDSKSPGNVACGGAKTNALDTAGIAHETS